MPVVAALFDSVEHAEQARTVLALAGLALSAAAEVAVTTGLLAGLSERVGTPAAAGLVLGALAGALMGIHAGGFYMREVARAYAQQVAIGAVMLVVGVPDVGFLVSVRDHLRACGARTLRFGFSPGGGEP